MAKALRPEIQELLASPACYDAAALEPLRQCLKQQVDGEWYSADACGALLRLYQSDPKLASPDDVALVLAKSLMQLPEADFALAMMLLPASLAKSDKAVALLEMGELLQQAKYAEFWTRLAASKIVVPGLVPAMQRYILLCISSTFKEISADALCDHLGVKSLSAVNLKANEQNQVVLCMPDVVRHVGGNDMQLAQFSSLIVALQKKAVVEESTFGQVSAASMDAVERMQKAMKEAL